MGGGANTNTSSVTLDNSNNLINFHHSQHNVGPSQPQQQYQQARPYQHPTTHQTTSTTASSSQKQQQTNKTTLNAIKNVPVTQIAIGPRHVALLLEDGRVARAPYQVLADRLEFPPPPILTSATNSNPSNQFANISSNVSHSSLALGGGGQSSHNAAHRLSVPSGTQTMNKNASLNMAIGGAGGAGAASSGGAGGSSGGGGSGNPSGPASVITSASGLAAAAGLDRNSSGLGPLGISGSGGPSGGAPGGGGPTGGSSSGGGSGSISSVPSFSGRVNISPQVGGGLSVQHRQAARRGRMLRHTASRGRGASVIMGSRAIIPAQYVPEDLINQAQVVLQGKPRSAIVRELQRTNLDVNSAVNNLLSSDNEDPEDMDEREDYLPNEDLMSLLDSSVSLPSGGPTSVLIDAETVFPEEVFRENFSSYAAARLRAGNIRHTLTIPERGASDRESSLASELEIRRMSSRDPSQSRRWLEHALRDPNSSDGANSRLGSATPTDFTLHHKSESNHGSSSQKRSGNPPEINPIIIAETIELWPGNDKKFVQIACLHSELIAISSNGQIHQWRWSDPYPFKGVKIGDVTNYHPKAAQLNLTHEKVQLLSASCVRASVVTQSSKVATWIDDTISMVASKLEHEAQSFTEFQRGDRIVQLNTCSLYTCVRLESGSLYWWGVAPFSQRKKNWKKIQSKAGKHSSGSKGNERTSTSSRGNEIGIGSIVCLKNGPSFGDGAVGFTTRDGVPRVGRLTGSAWSITDTCTFKIIQPFEKRTSIQATTNSESKTKTRKMLGQPLDFSGNVSLDDTAPQSPGMSKSSASERIEMPPPPSPASSTCSEPGCSPSHKRKHEHLIPSKNDEDKNEELWNLKDVIFLEEVKKPPAATVIKLDGNTALVKFNQLDPFGHTSDPDVNVYLQNCRMIKKDELQLAKETPSSSRIIDCQRSPKKLNITGSNNILTFTVSNNGIHAIVKNGNKIEYKMYQLASGKTTKSLSFSTDPNAFLGRDPSLITLYACGENDVAVTLRDGNGCLYPLAKDFLESLRDPQPLDMAPMQALGMAVHPVRDASRSHPTLVMAVALENQILMPAILRSDPELVRLTLASLDDEPVSQQVVASEKIDLYRNVLHAVVYTCAPQPSKSSSTSNRGTFVADDSLMDAYQPGLSRISGIIGESLKRSRRTTGASSTPNTSPSTLDLTSDSDRNRSAANRTLATDTSSLNLQSYENIAEWSNTIFTKIDIDPSEQKQSAHSVLLILVECPFMRPYLKDLMMQKDAYAMTPFMSAVSHRAYNAAVILMDLAQWIVSQEKDLDQEQKIKLFNSMIFPMGSHLDNNPLYMLCANDTCSFTWTGAQHINQDIFECKTCGLTQSLCCCTECARTCHKGHDCRLKKTSPNAYCDCWEKCKCKALVSGSQITRFKLLEKLLSDTDLVTYPDSKGESILLFLVQTVGRQMVEQRQYNPDRAARHSKRNEPADMPEHDSSPPRFARKALHRMLSEWLALKSAIMSGTSASQSLARLNSILNAEDQILLAGQQGTALLDRFTHSVLIKIGSEMLDVLLTTIIRESSSSNANRVAEARMVAMRFVRSVARNGVVLSVELSPVNYSQQMNMFDLSNQLLNPIGSSPYSGGGPSAAGSSPGGGGGSGSSSWKPSQQPASILQKCRKVFQALLPVAAEELAEIADALISPVRLGVPRPTAPFSLVNSMAEATQGSEEVFVVEPVVIPTVASTVDATTSNQDVSPASGELAIPSVRQGRRSSPPAASTASVATGMSSAASNIPSASSSSSNINEPASLNENPPSTLSDRMRFLDDIAMDEIYSEDADASNNTFRRSNNGETDTGSDSDADDVSFQSNMDPNGARSTATVATAGSEVGAGAVAYFSEGESGDSSNGDDDEESGANDTEHDTDDLPFANEDSFSFPRRVPVMSGSAGGRADAVANLQSYHHHSHHHSHHHTSSQHHHHGHHQPSIPVRTFRSTNLGQQLHWALRHRDQSFYPSHQSGSSSAVQSATASRLASIGLANPYTYMDGAHSRRSLGGQPASQSNHGAPSNSNELSMSTTAVGLSRAFSIIIRSISDLIPILKDAERLDSALTINQLRVSPTEAATIICNLEKRLNPVWEWLFKVMNSTEGQLRFGCALTNGIQAASQAASALSGVGGSSAASTLAASTSGRSQQPPPLLSGSSSSGGGALSYLPPMPVNPAMLARVNANLNVHGLGRRHLFPDEAAMVRVSHGGGSSGGPSGGSGASTSGGGVITGPPGPSNLADVSASGIRLHNPISQNSISRPQSLTTRSNLGPPGYVSRVPLTDNAANEEARMDFLSYIVSLMRAQHGEHLDSLPILDVSSLRHIAYVFDAYIYYLQALNKNPMSKPTDEWSEEDDEELLQSSASDPNSGSRHTFFRQAESTLFLDGLPDPFEVPLAEALPLAEQPHLLQPNSRREDLFGPSKHIQEVNLDSLPMQLGLSTPLSSTCARCLAIRQQHLQMLQTQQAARPGTRSTSTNLTTNLQDLLQLTCPQHKRDSEPKTVDVQHTALLSKWRLTVELFGREFLDDVGAEPGSILTDFVHFPMKEVRFRKEMERLRSDCAPREISLINIDRDKNTLIRQTIKELNNTYHLSERNIGRRNQEMPMLACSKVKVSFKDEKGEGNGVARSFYTAFCEAILSNEKLANLDAPLFYQPGLRNFYSPRQGEPTSDRLNAFRNVGRVIGICLSQSEICPIQLNRHVIKYILRKPILWHDLAFFDPILYESLRQLVLDAETSSNQTGNSDDGGCALLKTLDLRFCVDLCAEEGGGEQVELASSGKNIEVTPSNVYEYVRRYALKRMLKSQEKALQALRQGVMDVLPPCALDNLTAEDFRLLLNGVGEINVQTLIGYTSFIDDRGTSASKRNPSTQVEEQLGYFKKWFWSIVEKMTTKERQDLVYFWTGSPSLPASDEGFQPMPTVSIRPAEDLHLPTSNVCIFRLYIPLYSSKAILRSKLLIAIKEKNFGFI